MKRKPGPFEEGHWCTAKKVTLLIFPNLLQRDLQAFTRVTVQWGKGNNHTFAVTGSELALIPEDSRLKFGPLWFHFGHTEAYAGQVINGVQLRPILQWAP